VRVGIIALREVACPAVRTSAAGNGRTYNDAVACAEIAHVRPSFLDDAYALVPQDGPGLHAGEGAPHHVQVSAADGRSREPNNRVGVVFELWFRNIVQPNIADPVEYNSSHYALLMFGEPL